MKPKKLKNRISKVYERRPKIGLPKAKAIEEKFKEAISTVPKITDDTVSEYREEVLGKARRYIYPLKHSRKHFVRLSLSILAGVIVVFIAFCAVELYAFQATSGFIYSVSDIIPFPVAKAGPSWISYSSYLFELKRNMHYYITQQQADFSTKAGGRQLKSLKQQAMDQVISNAYVKQLASANDVKVSSQDVNTEVNLLKVQNRLGNSKQVFDDVLKEYWGWSESDFNHELSEQLLQQAVVVKLDTGAQTLANSVYKQLQGGTSLATLAETYSDDSSTKANGGQYAGYITMNDGNLAPQITNELFKLKAGQISDIINTGYTLEILKVISISGNSVQAAHIQFNLEPISIYTAPLQKAHPPKEFISI